jgi:hypothetical protein
MHYNGVCTSNVFNCHFIKKWKDKVNNIVYDDLIEVLRMYCPNNNNKCKKKLYNFYDTCKL